MIYRRLRRQMTQHPYGRSFWWAYLANIALMVAVSLLFRYADFITFLGGTEKQLGFITGVGMVGAIGARCFQGMAIDRYGPARIWMLSLVLLIVCVLSHLAVGSLHPPLIHLLRLAYMVSLAGAFGASITHVSFLAPPHRLAEVIGMLGSSGFVGMAIGPVIGDWLFGAAQRAHPQRGVLDMFAWAAVAAACSLAFTWLATRRGGAVAKKTGPMGGIRTLWRLVRSYHPGSTLLVGIAMGIGIGMPSTFLRTFAADRGCDGIRHFFLTYAIVAFVFRIGTRKLADRWGKRPTIILGLSALAASMLAYLAVTTERSLVIPAALAGIAHAFLFPATVAEASQSFPPQYRGLATNLILTMFDTGLLIGQPTIGFTVEAVRGRGGDGYFVAFMGLGVVMLIVAAIYGMGPAARVAPLKKQSSNPCDMFTDALDEVPEKVA